VCVVTKKNISEENRYGNIVTENIFPVNLYLK